MKTDTEPTPPMPTEGPVNDIYALLPADEIIRLINASKDPPETLRELCRHQYAALKSWRKVAEPLGISAPMARLIADGRAPGEKVRHVLRMAETAPAPVCRKCGNVHVTKTCTANRKPPTRWADYPLHLLRAAIENRKEM